MPESVQYRLLEQFRDGAWRPFGVAYDRDGALALFCPAWRSQRALSAASLAELGSDDFPAEGATFRWREPAVCGRAVGHPLELLEHAVQTAPAAERESRPLAPWGAPGLAWGATREAAEGGPGEAPSPDIANLLERAARDPALQRALEELQAAYESSHRDELLRALAAFARAARRRE
jgi:hypothetical protein